MTVARADLLAVASDGIWTGTLYTPAILRVSPATLALAGGAVTLSCRGAKSAQGSGSVKVNGSAETIVAWGDQAITFTASARSAGAYDVVLTNSDGLSDTLTSGLSYVATTEPTGPSTAGEYDFYTITTTPDGVRSYALTIDGAKGTLERQSHSAGKQDDYDKAVEQYMLYPDTILTTAARGQYVLTSTYAYTVDEVEQFDDHTEIRMIRVKV